MPVKHLRVCERCNLIRYAGCSPVCRAPNPDDPYSWRLNLQHGAGQLLKPPPESAPDCATDAPNGGGQ